MVGVVRVQLWSKAELWGLLERVTRVIEMEIRHMVGVVYGGW